MSSLIISAACWIRLTRFQSLLAVHIHLNAPSTLLLILTFAFEARGVTRRRHLLELVYTAFSEEGLSLVSNLELMQLIAERTERPSSLDHPTQMCISGCD